MHQYLSNEANVRSTVNNMWGQSEYVDFRDLFLNATTAATLGTSATEPYGDLAPKLMEMITSFISDPDETGSPGINSAFIEPFTKKQSGIPGTILISMDDKKSESVSSQIKVDSIQIDNLDTVGYPLKVFHPHVDNPRIIQNEARIGMQWR